MITTEVAAVSPATNCINVNDVMAYGEIGGSAPRGCSNPKPHRPRKFPRGTPAPCRLHGVWGKISSTRVAAEGRGARRYRGTKSEISVNPVPIHSVISPAYTIMASRAPFHDKRVISIADLEREATRRMPKMYRDYFNDGATEMTR